MNFSLRLFLKNEIVLVVSVLLALFSSFFVHPDMEYFSYIDWNTIALLFSLMAVVKGFQKAGVFESMANKMLRRTSDLRGMITALVFLPFFLSMLITNDVALITFVPFGLVVLKIAGREEEAVFLVVMQTLAANLGSMLTPMGNPQNLYLYTKSGISFGGMCFLMLPYVVFSALFIFFSVFARKNSPVRHGYAVAAFHGRKSLVFYALGFVLCLLSVFKVVPPLVTAVIIAVLLAFFDRKVLRQVDYPLLLTFIALFIFIGNTGRLDFFRNFLSSVLEKNVSLVAVLASQVTSNVPAALLLSGFTEDYKNLITGCNIGGLGTLIASMASLISYKFIAKSYPERKTAYFVQFTLWNIALLFCLLVMKLCIECIFKN